VAHSLNKLVRKARHGANDAELKSVLTDVNPHDLQQVVAAGARACGLHSSRKNNLPARTNIIAYCLVIPDAETLTYKSPEVRTLASKTYEVLGPYIDANEARIEGFNYIHCDITNALGITFNASSRAARAVAAAFPDMTVVDAKRNIIPSKVDETSSPVAAGENRRPQDGKKPERPLF
jgi:hypothetical protein